ncbi:hypothetical protein OS493_026320 [Desmophyllum pertusum]|uniref:Uncharacterized protein n=1 Tax=Desmophyllum pertusum TaxID=174260 RepID=A0A9X0D231_9CNID|nr:hypothetical protein OS493_026320 [Desmophyllum pertusum]
MPGDPSPKASPGGVISYNGDSARGWNDPQLLPSLITKPATDRNDVANGVAGLKLNGVTQPLFTPQPVTTSAPLLNNVLSAPSIPAVFTRSISTPSFTDPVVTNTNQAPVHSALAVNPPAVHVHAKSTDNLSGNLGNLCLRLKTIVLNQ